MSDNEQDVERVEVEGASIAQALQAHLDTAGVNDDGAGLRLGGYAAVIVYVRPDGTSGMTVLAPYGTAEQVLGVLDAAAETVATASTDEG